MRTSSHMRSSWTSHARCRHRAASLCLGGAFACLALLQVGLARGANGLPRGTWVQPHSRLQGNAIFHAGYGAAAEEISRLIEQRWALHCNDNALAPEHIRPAARRLGLAMATGYRVAGETPRTANGHASHAASPAGTYHLQAPLNAEEALHLSHAFNALIGMHCIGAGRIIGHASRSGDPKRIPWSRLEPQRVREALTALNGGSGSFLDRFDRNLHIKDPEKAPSPKLDARTAPAATG
jgi:hypothetical protein